MPKGRLPVHGMSKSPEYAAWLAMRKRCYYPKTNDYARYGGSGITVCDEWRYSFQAFYAYVGSKPSPYHSLDRIDGTRNYEPGNVRWATAKEQANNRIKPKLVPTPRVCAECKKEFSVHPYIAKRGDGKFCSLSCSMKTNRRKFVENGHQLVTVTCVCGKTFQRTPYQVARRKTMSCSLKCRELTKKRERSITPTSKELEL